MNVTLNHGFNYSTNVARALASATNVTFTTDRRGAYMANGFRFANARKFSEWLMSEISGWMGDCGLVNVEALRTAHNSHGYQYFIIN
jgi:hypothetical protein